MISSIFSELLVLFVPQLLSPLHLASNYSYNKVKERENELNRLSKKMFLIANSFVKNEEEKVELSNGINHVELFYKVYSQLDYLTLREVKILRDFCYALYNPYDLTIVREDEIESEDDIYSKYGNVLDNYMDKMKNKKNNFKY